MQSQSRGEIDANENRFNIRQRIGKLREKNLLFLDACVKKAEKESIDLNDKLEDLYNTFIQQYQIEMAKLH